MSYEQIGTENCNIEIYRHLFLMARQSDNVVLHAGVMPWPLASVNQTCKNVGIKLAKARQYIAENEVCAESPIFKQLLPDCPSQFYAVNALRVASTVHKVNSLLNANKGDKVLLICAKPHLLSGITDNIQTCHPHLK
jgi:hypothetical protein